MPKYCKHFGHIDIYFGFVITVSALEYCQIHIVVVTACWLLTIVNVKFEIAVRLILIG